MFNIKTSLLCPLCLIVLLVAPTPTFAEDDDGPSDESSVETGSPSSPAAEPVLRPKGSSKPKRKYFIEDTKRVDAGVFHISFAAGGNFYIEPKLDRTTKAPLGEYFKDGGFQGGANFDYDYDDIGLGLRGFAGYKYILSSISVFEAQGIARILFRFSESVNFGLGTGISAALWYRKETDTSPNEEVIFLPSWVIEFGFDFNPFMVDAKWLINRFGEDSTIFGFELMFGVRV